jgi:hypothetical protein
LMIFISNFIFITASTQVCGSLFKIPPWIVFKNSNFVSDACEMCIIYRQPTVCETNDVTSLHSFLLGLLSLIYTDLLEEVLWSWWLT